MSNSLPRAVTGGRVNLPIPGSRFPWIALVLLVLAEVTNTRCACPACKSAGLSMVKLISGLTTCLRRWYWFWSRHRRTGSLRPLSSGARMVNPVSGLVQRMNWPQTHSGVTGYAPRRVHLMFKIEKVRRPHQDFDTLSGEIFKKLKPHAGQKIVRGVILPPLKTQRQQLQILGVQGQIGRKPSITWYNTNVVNGFQGRCRYSP